MRAFRLSLGVSFAVVLGVVGCSDTNRNNGGGDGTEDGGPNLGGDAGPGGLLGSGDGSIGMKVGVCSPGGNNYDFPGNKCDDDGDGTVDNAPAPCDAALAVGGDGAAFAKAMGICQAASANTWGLVSATFTSSHVGAAAPNASQHGILPKFGSVVKPREGGALGVLSTGFAREFDEETNLMKPFKGIKSPPMQAAANAVGSLPMGFPKSAMGCPSQATASTHDLINAKLEIKVPTNANGIQFDFNFWSGEWPEYVCSEFNDAFIAYLTSKSFVSGAGGNMSFDTQGNPVSVNNGFFDRCTPNAKTGCLAAFGMAKTAVCPGDTAELAGTGFDFPGNYCGGIASGGGATGWLTSKAPVQPGETITLELIIWDVGDANYDSSVLLDHFQWVEGTTDANTERPPR